MTDPIVVVEDLVKVYPGGTRAVDGIGFTVASGEFFGFLGPNGAGKSTTLKVLSTLIRKTSGRVIVAGHDVDRDPKAVRKSIGFAMQDVGLDDLSTGRNFLELQGVLFGLTRKQSKARASELLELVGLSDVAKRKVGTYSGGMRRRIDLVAALVHRPTLLFLDEPTTGLDPQSRVAIWEHLDKLSREGVTIFLTTQLMDEADRLCRRIAIIDHGRIVAAGSPQTLKEEVGGDVVHVRIAGDDPAVATTADGRIAQAEAIVRAQPYVMNVVAQPPSLAITVKDGSAAAADLMRTLHEAGFQVATISVARPSLDDVFLKHTGRTIRAEATSGEESAQALRPLLGLSKNR
jgi:daunorubicin resistance ABC transporter ATP-binding subunit